LPDVIQFRNGNQIKNTYNAGGQKLGTEYFTQLTNITPLADGQIISPSYNPGTVDQTGNAYIGNVEYVTQNGNSSLTAISRIYNGEGYVENVSSPKYYYYRKDHLGNNREVWLANTNTTVQKTQYYPSGLPMAAALADSVGKQQRKYNGKELVEMHGYDTYDYGARGYYAAIGGWTSVDPHAEKYYSISPYSYCLGNPIRLIDIDGRDPGDFFSSRNNAAKDFGHNYNDNSIRSGKEYASRIYMIEDSKRNIGYTYTVPDIGNSANIGIPNAPIGSISAGLLHTHGNYSFGKWLDNIFSGSVNIETNEANTPKENKTVTNIKTDLGNSNILGEPIYVGTPNGSLSIYDPKTGKISIIDTTLPSDQNDPSKLNNKDANVEQKPIDIPKPINLYIPSPNRPYKYY
jgi:RHS repeat-associated protein